MENRLTFLVLNGPNLDLLGEREPGTYGRTTLKELEALCRAWGAEKGVDIRCAQSNHEGELVDLLHAARLDTRGVVLNAAAYTHTSVALRDALAAVQCAGVPAVEVHLSNTQARDDFRHTSLTAPVCLGQVSGFHGHSYVLGLDALVNHLMRKTGSVR